MKVLVLSHMFPSYELQSKRSGVFVYQLVKAIKNEGADVLVISPVPHISESFAMIRKTDWVEWDKKLPYYEMYDDINVFFPRYNMVPFMWKQTFSFHHFFMAMGIRSLFEEVLRTFSPDIIHSHTLLPDTAAAIYLRKKISLNIPIVGTLHGGELTYPMNISTFYQYPKKSNWFFYMKSMENVIANSDGIIVVSEVLRKFIDHYWHSEKYRVIYNGVPDDWLCLSEEKNNWIVFIGALIERKRPLLLCEAFIKSYAYKRGWQLVMVGDGKLRGHIVKKYKRYIEEGSIILKGNLPHKEVERILSLSKVFVLPSVREPFGVSFIEAMAHGLPAVGCKDGGASEIIENNVSGFLINPDSEEELIDKIDYLCKNDDIRKSMGRASYERVKEKFLWSKIARETIDYYKEVICTYYNNPRL